jgi:hypothetical protein
MMNSASTTPSHEYQGVSTFLRNRTLENCWRQIAHDIEIKRSGLAQVDNHHLGIGPYDVAWKALEALMRIKLSQLSGQYLATFINFNSSFIAFLLLDISSDIN